MDSRYSITVTAANRQVLTTTMKTQLTVAAQAAASGIRLGRVIVYDALFGSAILPNSTDCEIEHDIAVTTVVGTATAFTPTKLDSASTAASALGAIGHTVEPTVGASVLNLTLNQRASFRWAAVPGSELIGAATAATGWAMRALSSTYVGKIADTVFFAE